VREDEAKSVDGLAAIHDLARDREPPARAGAVARVAHRSQASRGRWLTCVEVPLYPLSWTCRCPRLAYWAVTFATENSMLPWPPPVSTRILASSSDPPIAKPAVSHALKCSEMVSVPHWRAFCRMLQY
jgi:hypothetical protein